MSKFIKIWVGKPSYKRVLFRYGEGRSWRFLGNWKFNGTFNRHSKGFFRWNIITPFLRFQRDNCTLYFGLGNHYFEIGLI